MLKCCHPKRYLTKGVQTKATGENSKGDIGTSSKASVGRDDCISGSQIQCGDTETCLVQL